MLPSDQGEMSMKNVKTVLAEARFNRNSVWKCLVLAVMCAGFISCTDEMTDEYETKADLKGGPHSLVPGVASIDCVNYTCSSNPEPLPDNVNTATSYSPWGSSVSECYYAGADYQFESGYDYLNFGNAHLTGTGVYGTHWCGNLPMSITTDYSVYSSGLHTAWFDHHSVNVAPPSNQCAGIEGGWEGCRGTGCHACIELLTDYPNYFVNHPSCVPNMTCDNQHYTCSANCPAPSAADR